MEYSTVRFGHESFPRFPCASRHGGWKEGNDARHRNFDRHNHEAAIDGSSRWLSGVAAEFGNRALSGSYRIVAELGGHTAQPPTAAIVGSFVVVSVEIAVPRIIPFFPSTVTRRALEPRERFVPESNR